MNGQRRPVSGAKAKGKSPAERSEEFTATQRQLKQEAADRRDAKKADETEPDSSDR